MERRSRIGRPALVAAVALVAALVFLTAAGAAAGPRNGTAKGAGATLIKAGDGTKGGETGTGQGSDQGEDQGENIFQFGKGPFHIGPTSVSAANTIGSGNVNGGKGGDVSVTFNDYVTTTCGNGQTELFSLPQTVVVTAGKGGAGGKTGEGQGSDQGEDQGENIGQAAGKGTHLSPSMVEAVNSITSGDALGGKGGDVTVVFNTYTTCAPASQGPKNVPPPTSDVTQDASGNIQATYTTYVACDAGTPQPFDIVGGAGGAGGQSGKEQGSDQGEDQGENIGQFAKGGPRPGPTTVSAPNNTIHSADATGTNGGTVTVTFDNYMDLTCATGPSSSFGSVVVNGGAGGKGGHTGIGQGADQGEDQGENVGQFAKGGAAVGSVSVKAHNSNLSGSATGGSGGDVSVTYNDFGTCAGVTPSPAVKEGVGASAGAGGQGGNSGAGQGSDQGEDQGENIGQFSSKSSFIGAVTVGAHNTNVAGPAKGGVGGNVQFAYNDGSCTVPAASSNELSTAAGGLGGKGGSSGHEQGADQGEDQGENIGQFSNGRAAVHFVSVHAVNRNVSGDVSGGDGGNVLIPTSSGGCPTPDSRVTGTPGGGGTAGTTGVGQGSDQGEDQGENIGMGARKSGHGRTTVHADNANHAGPAKAGGQGSVGTACSALRARPHGGPLADAATASRPAFPGDPGVVRCDGTFKGKALDLEVPVKGVCRIRPGASIKHNIDVGTGGSLFSVRAKVGHDIILDQALKVHISGGRVGHDLLVEGPGFGRSRGTVVVCGVRVLHSLVVAEGTRGASPIVVGGPHCPGNIVSSDLTVSVNQGHVTVWKNKVGHDASCFENHRLSARSNRAVHLNNCPPIHGR
jgi:hypothetical protein